MYYVYLIESKKNQSEIYVGSTNDLRRRLREHNMGDSWYTRRHAPWELIYYEAYKSESDAREREKRLKSHGKGIAELKKRIRNSIEG